MICYPKKSCDIIFCDNWKDPLVDTKTANSKMFPEVCVNTLGLNVLCMTYMDLSIPLLILDCFSEKRHRTFKKF